MTETTNYQLSQWEAEDRVLHTDFNADNARLDAALKTIADQAQRLERAAERANFNAYSLILQQDYAGAYTGWCRDIIFDGFQDNSKIASMTPGLALRTEHPGLYLNESAASSGTLISKPFEVVPWRNHLQIWYRSSQLASCAFSLRLNETGDWIALSGLHNTSAVNLWGEKCFIRTYDPIAKPGSATKMEIKMDISSIVADIENPVLFDYALILY